MKKRTQENNGVIYKHIDSDNDDNEGTLTFEDRRFVINGRFSITDMRGSWKYGEQIQLRIWSKEAPKTEMRANNGGWCELAIYLPKHIALSMLKEAGCI